MSIIIVGSPDSDKSGYEIHFGKVRAGETKTTTVFAKNVGENELENLNFWSTETDGESVKVIKSPKALAPGDSGEVVLEWIPHVSRKKGLKCWLNWKGDEVYIGE